MPHAFWHQWGDERTEQERLQAAALERIANLDEYGTTDPSIWDKYIVRDQLLGGGEKRLDRAQEGLGQLAEQIYSLPYVPEALGGLEKFQENILNPVVSSRLGALPVRWEESPPDAPKGGEGAWWDPVVPDRLQQGRVVRDFDQYLTPEGEISPGGDARQFWNVASPISAVEAVVAETTPQQLPRPNTLQQQNIMEEARTRGMGPDLSGKEQREIREDLYKLPPYTRGIAEELPWFALGTAKSGITGLQALRASPALATAGTLGKAAPVARGALRTVEIGLKPIAYGEKLLEIDIKTATMQAGQMHG